MKVLIVEDHAIVRSGLRRLLAALPAAEIAEAADGREALAALRAVRPDLVILDLNLPGLGGFELLRRITAKEGAPRVLVLSMHAEPLHATRALQAGAAAYVSKNAAPEELLAAIRRVAAGGRYVENEIAREMALQGAAGGGLAGLTERELEILRQLGAGRALAGIAEALGVSYKTVANACTQIKAKVGAARTADLIRLAVEMGLR